MEFKTKIKNLGERVLTLKDQVQTEEATKNAFIMPFIQALGYDVFNPTEVIPEFTADLGIKKGEKIDYSIFRNGDQVMLIECKSCNENLNVHEGQLMRYFHVSKGRIGLLTNGIVYRFYSDLVDANKMDEKPFLEFNITEISDNQIDELYKFHNSVFDIETILRNASDLKIIHELNLLVKAEFTTPSAEFVKYFAKQIYTSNVTPKIIDQFTSLVTRAIKNHTNEIISMKLKNALNDVSIVESVIDVDVPTSEIDAENKIETTVEELEAFMIIKSILRQKIDIKRLSYRDAQSYFAIILDDNNRKTVARLYFNGKKKYIAFLDESKKEQKIEIQSLDDIFTHSDLFLSNAEKIN